MVSALPGAKGVGTNGRLDNSQDSGRHEEGLKAWMYMPPSEAPARPLTAKEKRNMLATPPNRRGENWSGRAGDVRGQTGLQEACRDTRPLQTIDIESAVATHEALRASGDGAAADRIREQLHRAGIHIDDNARMWRSADGRQGTACSGHCARPGCPDLFESVPRSVS